MVPAWWGLPVVHVRRARRTGGNFGDYLVLTIRREQWDVLARAEWDNYENWVHDHVLAFFPRKYKAAGEAHIREMIHYGIERAVSHGFTIKSDVCRYIDLMVVLGRDFDTDERLAWAADILGKKKHASRKIKALEEAAGKHMSRP
jgi:hypothetical protein